MEPEEAARFLAAASEGEYLALFFIALRAGLRQGQLLALRWQEIDFAKNLIHVQRRWYRGTFDSPKGNRTRSVDMSPQLKGVLQFAHEEAGEQRITVSGFPCHKAAQSSLIS